MKLKFIAAFALAVPSSLLAQGNVPDSSVATPLSGNWTYSPVTGGSEAKFVDASGNAQLWVQCTRATRRVTIAKPATAAVALIDVWTSSMTRSVPASFNPTTMRLGIEFAPYDSLLDAIMSSRGRVGFSVGTQPALVVPPWAEAARVIEDCRA